MNLKIEGTINLKRWLVGVTWGTAPDGTHGVSLCIGPFQLVVNWRS